MKRLMMAVVLAMWVGPAMAWNWYALGVAEMAAHGGATHMAVFDHSDLTTTNTNTAQTFTNSMPAKHAAEFVACLLDTAFTVGTTNYTDALALKIGDGSTTDLLMSSTELASDGTEVWVQFAPIGTYAAASTPTTVTTNLITLRSGATNVSQTVTNAVVKTLTVATTTTGTAKGRKYSASAWNMVFTFTPDSNQSVSAFTAGKVRVYFRVFDGR